MSTVTDSTEKRLLSGTGKLIGPPQDAHFFSVMEFLMSHLPQFGETIASTDLQNENALNGRLSRFITNVADDEEFFADREIMEDETRGDSPATDIGIFLKVPDCSIDPPLITVLEGKRLTTTLGTERRREYVYGHEKHGRHIPCGGIERFKLSIHGRQCRRHAGMIGYIQEETPEYWQGQINSWISDLSLLNNTPKWSEEECLRPFTTEGRISKSVSVVNRKANSLYLTHLWVNLVS